INQAIVRVSPGHDMNVVVVHWSTYHIQQQLVMTVSAVAPLAGPVVVLGDFLSLEPDSVEITTILEEGDLRDAFKDLHNKTSIVREWNQPYILYRRMEPKSCVPLDNSLDYSG